MKKENDERKNEEVTFGHLHEEFKEEYNTNPVCTPNGSCKIEIEKKNSNDTIPEERKSTPICSEQDDKFNPDETTCIRIDKSNDRSKSTNFMEKIMS